jgi:hypothetical protein
MFSPDNDAADLAARIVLKREQCVCNRGPKVCERPEPIRRNIFASGWKMLDHRSSPLVDDGDIGWSTVEDEWWRAISPPR